MSLSRVRACVALVVLLGAALQAAPATAQKPSASPSSGASPVPSPSPDPEGMRLLEDARRRVEEVQARIAAASEKETAVLAELDEVDREINAIALDLQNVKEQVAAARARSEEHQIAMDEIRGRIGKRKRWLSGRLRSLYVHGRPGYLRILFASESYGDLLRRSKYQSIVARRDARLVGELKADLDEVARRRTDYEQDLALLERMESESRGRNEALVLEKELRATLLADARSERSSYEKMRDALQRSADALVAEVGKLGGGAAVKVARPFSEMKGALLPPVAGAKVTLPFGPYRHPRLGLPMIHQGLKYGAAPGSEVRAVHEGRVEMARWFSSYGQVLIVDHGEGWRSLYAHNSALLKKDGDVVREGETIALSGDTGSLDGPELYFALYREGKPVDPAEWLIGGSPPPPPAPAPSPMASPAATAAASPAASPASSPGP